MGESSGKASMNEIYDVLEQQKKLEEIKALIFDSLEKINQTVNAITVSFKKLDQKLLNFTFSNR